jgi:hypothetical protein
MKRELFTPRIFWWSIGAAVVISIVGLTLVINRVTVQSTEIASARSPDGAAYDHRFVVCECELKRAARLEV